MILVKMKLAYACKCVYCLDNYEVSDSDFYPELYVNFMNDIEKGFQLNLDMLVAKDKDIMVFCCGHCVNKIGDKICIFPEYPENIDCVCNRFPSCYANIWCFLEGIGKLCKFSGRQVIQYLHLKVYPVPSPDNKVFCNMCMCYFIMSLKQFSCLIFIDKY